MGWSIGYDNNWKRDIGYGVPAICDSPRCNAEIDRGLSYVCGSEPYGGERGCGLFFCAPHLTYHIFRDGESAYVCSRCDTSKPPYKPKQDTKEWVFHKLKDPSWQEWRLENKGEVTQLRLKYLAPKRIDS